MWLYFCHIWWFLFFFLIFDNSILSLCSSNITCDCSFVIFGGSHFFFPHIWWLYCHIRQYQHNIWQYFCHILWFFFPYLIVSIFTLCSTNITCDCTLVTFDGSFIFSYIWWFHCHIRQYQHHIWLYFCYIW